MEILILSKLFSKVYVLCTYLHYLVLSNVGFSLYSSKTIIESKNVFSIDSTGVRLRSYNIIVLRIHHRLFVYLFINSVNNGTVNFFVL